ncbi:MAG: DUF222 domain-containing protein [Ilumatobacteraceae bacterium]
MIQLLLEHAVGLSDAELQDELERVEIEDRALAARRSALIAAAEARKLHRRDGHHSMRNHLRATCNSSRGTTTRQLRRAGLIDRIPAVGDALLAGRIGVAQADELARAFANPRIADFLPAVAPLLLDHAEHLPFDDFKVCVDRWMMLADLDGSHRTTLDEVGGRSARVVSVGTAVDLAASGGDALTAEKLIKIFERFCNAEFDKDVEARRAEFGDTADEHRLPRSGAQRRFDALEAIFDAAIAAPVGGRAPEPVVNIVADADTVDETFTRAELLLPTGDQVDLGDLEQDELERIIDELTADPARLIDRHCETESGILVHPVLLLQAALTGHVRRVVVDSPGRVVDLGHLQRLFTGSARIAATLLARHCSHPGCDIPASGCDVDHMDAWAADDGPTDQHNADVRCGSHDRFKHRRRWRTRRAPNGRVYSIRPDDTIVLTAGERPPDLTRDEQDRITHRRMAELIARRSARSG